MQTLTWTLILFMLVMMGMIGRSDYRQEFIDEIEYCEMVGIWDADASQGILPVDRGGWPPYDPHTTCED